jgi:prepilin-type N-terminal cleavage/methylation domain-containing protein
MNNNRAFTLIELMIVITIISIISLATYIPYAHHQKKTLIKQAAREITQSLSEARNLAINGLSTLSGANLNV